MKVCLTKTMAKEIKKNCKDIIAAAALVEFTPEKYRLLVDYNGGLFMDYNMNTGNIKAIKISYPESFYACPRYITSKDLRRVFEASNKTYTGFFERIREEIEI